jgi:hypothetical protein
MEDRKYFAYNGEKTITNSGTPEPLATETTRVKRVTVQAKSTNLSDIKIGASNFDATTALQMTPYSTRTYYNTDLKYIYVDGDNGEGVTFEVEQ